MGPKCTWPENWLAAAFFPITLCYIKEYFVPGLRAGPARHYKCHEENKLGMDGYPDPAGFH